MSNAQFFEDVEFAGVKSIRDFVFEEEYVDIPQGVFENDQDQDSIPDIVQEATPDQDNVIEPPVQVQEVFQKKKLYTLKNQCH